MSGDCALSDLFAFDDVANAQPQSSLVRGSDIFFSMLAAKADYQVKLIAHADAGETFFQMSIERQVIFRRERAIKKIAE